MTSGTTSLVLRKIAHCIFIKSSLTFTIVKLASQKQWAETGRLLISRSKIFALNKYIFSAALSLNKCRGFYSFAFVSAADFFHIRWTHLDFVICFSGQMLIMRFHLIAPTSENLVFVVRTLRRVNRVKLNQVDLFYSSYLICAKVWQRWHEVTMLVAHVTPYIGNLFWLLWPSIYSFRLHHIVFCLSSHSRVLHRTSSAYKLQCFISTKFSWCAEADQLTWNVNCCGTEKNHQNETNLRCFGWWVHTRSPIYWRKSDQSDIALLKINWSIFSFVAVRSIDGRRHTATAERVPAEGLHVGLQSSLRWGEGQENHIR